MILLLQQLLLACVLSVVEKLSVLKDLGKIRQHWRLNFPRRINHTMDHLPAMTFLSISFQLSFCTLFWLEDHICLPTLLVGGHHLVFHRRVLVLEHVQQWFSSQEVLFHLNHESHHQHHDSHQIPKIMKPEFKTNSSRLCLVVYKNFL